MMDWCHTDCSFSTPAGASINALHGTHRNFCRRRPTLRSPIFIGHHSRLPVPSRHVIEMLFFRYRLQQLVNARRRQIWHPGVSGDLATPTDQTRPSVTAARTCSDGLMTCFNSEQCIKADC